MLQFGMSRYVLLLWGWNKNCILSNIVYIFGLHIHWYKILEHNALKSLSFMKNGTQKAYFSYVHAWNYICVCTGNCTMLFKVKNTFVKSVLLQRMQHLQAWHSSESPRKSSVFVCISNRPWGKHPFRPDTLSVRNKRNSARVFELTTLEYDWWLVYRTCSVLIFRLGTEISWHTLRGKFRWRPAEMQFAHHGLLDNRPHAAAM